MVAAAVCPPPATVLLSRSFRGGGYGKTSNRAIAGHRRRLARRLRGVDPPARASHGLGGTRPRLRHRANNNRAVRLAVQTSLRPCYRPAGLLVLPPARMVEENRADG